MTVDPRNIDVGLPATIPFVLFPRQVQWVNWVLARWRAREDGFTEKSRDMGMSWLTVGVVATLLRFYDSMAIGFGSRKQEYVDLKGAPKAFFERLRMFMDCLPLQFRGGWDRELHSPNMRLHIPETGSTVNGEIGDEIGRGDRTALYFVDETAFLDHPLMADAALSQTTNCRQDITTPSPASSAAPVAQKRRSMPPHRIFTCHWRDDPRKDQAWYDQELADHGEVIVAREIDINWLASVEGVLIPAAWARAAVGAAQALGISPGGVRRGGFDVADEGGDKCAFAGRYGQELKALEQWAGKGADIFASVEKVFGFAHALDCESFVYDADGLGAGVRGDARIISDRRRKEGLRVIGDLPFHGSGAVLDPDSLCQFGHGLDAKSPATKRTNKDMFANLKAQAWYHLRWRFQTTYRAVVEHLPYNAEDIISIDPGLKLLEALMLQLQQPTYSLSGSGKIVVDKAPDGVKSPDLADAVMICFSPVKLSRSYFG